MFRACSLAERSGARIVNCQLSIVNCQLKLYSSRDFEVSSRHRVVLYDFILCICQILEGARQVKAEGVEVEPSRYRQVMVPVGFHSVFFCLLCHAPAFAAGIDAVADVEPGGDQGEGSVATVARGVGQLAVVAFAPRVGFVDGALQGIGGRELHAHLLIYRHLQGEGGVGTGDVHPAEVGHAPDVGSGETDYFVVDAVDVAVEGELQGEAFP